MDGEKSFEMISPELIDCIEKAAISEAREILSGRRIIDVEGPYGVGLTAVEVGNDELTHDSVSGQASAVVSRALAIFPNVTSQHSRNVGSR